MKDSRMIGFNMIFDHDKYRGEKISQEQAIIIKLRIQEFTRVNNDDIRSNISKKMPSKFSTDLADIEQTCIIEKQILAILKNLRSNQSLSRLQYTQQINTISRISREKREEIDRIQTQLRQVNQRNDFLEEENKKLLKGKQKEKEYINTMKRKQKDMMEKIAAMEKKLLAMEHKNFELARSLQAERQRGGRNFVQVIKKQYENDKEITNVEIFQSRVANNPSKNECISRHVIEHLKQFSQSNLNKQLIQSRQQSKRYKMIIEDFVSTIESILKFKMQKLQEMGDIERSDYIKVRYLPNMHLHLSKRLFEKEGFLWAEMMKDFQYVVIQAEKIKLENDKYMQVNKDNLIDRNMIKQVVNQLRNISSTILEEFELVGGKRRQLKELYQDTFPQMSSFEVRGLYQQLTIDNLIQFKKHHMRLLSQIQAQIKSFTSIQSKLKQMIKHSQPEYFKLLKQTNLQCRQNKKQCDKIQKNKNQYLQRIKDQEKQLELQRDDDFLLSGQESSEERAKRVGKDMFEEMCKYLLSCKEDGQGKGEQGIINLEDFRYRQNKNNQSTNNKNSDFQARFNQSLEKNFPHIVLMRKEHKQSLAKFNVASNSLSNNKNLSINDQNRSDISKNPSFFPNSVSMSIPPYPDMSNSFMSQQKSTHMNPISSNQNKYSQIHSQSRSNQFQSQQNYAIREEDLDLDSLGSEKREKSSNGDNASSYFDNSSNSMNIFNKRHQPPSYYSSIALSQPYSGTMSFPSTRSFSSQDNRSPSEIYEHYNPPSYTNSSSSPMRSQNSFFTSQSNMQIHPSSHTSINMPVNTSLKGPVNNTNSYQNMPAIGNKNELSQIQENNQEWEI